MYREKISVVIPCYCSENSIYAVVEETIKELEKLERYDYEFILVNDGSLDGTYQQIEKLAAAYSFVVGVNLAKNSGQHNAILAGMRYAEGDLIVGMDDDFQTQPSQIGKLLAKLDEGYDIVYGKFPKRHHDAMRNIVSRVSHYSVCFLLGKPKELVACPMYVIRRFVRDEVIKSESSYTNLQGLFLQSTSRIANADIEHYDRKFGKSGYNLKKLMRLWTSLLNYSEKPIRLILIGGSFILYAGLIYLILSLCLGWRGQNMVCATIMSIGGLLLQAMGVVGEYVMRAFMIISKAPQYIVREDTKKEEDKIYG